MRLSLGLGFTPAGLSTDSAPVIVPPIETTRETSSQQDRITSGGELRKVS